MIPFESGAVSSRSYRAFILFDVTLLVADGDVRRGDVVRRLSRSAAGGTSVTAGDWRFSVGGQGAER